MAWLSTYISITWGIWCSVQPQPGGAFDRKTGNIVGNLTKIFLSQMPRGLPVGGMGILGFDWYIITWLCSTMKAETFFTKSNRRWSNLKQGLSQSLPKYFFRSVTEWLFTRAVLTVSTGTSKWTSSQSLSDLIGSSCNWVDADTPVQTVGLVIPNTPRYLWADIDARGTDPSCCMSLTTGSSVEWHKKRRI